jgi:hypothetical protein
MQLASAVTSIAVLFNPTNPATATRRSAEGRPCSRAASADDRRPPRQSDIEPAFAEMAQQHAGAVVVLANFP